MRWIWLLGWLGLCFAVAGVSGRWTASEIPEWYRTLIRPAISPPNWVFGPVWTLLYALMAVAAWQIGQSPASPQRTWGLAAVSCATGAEFRLVVDLLPPTRHRGCAGGGCGVMGCHRRHDAGLWPGRALGGVADGALLGLGQLCRGSERGVLAAELSQNRCSKSGSSDSEKPQKPLRAISEPLAAPQVPPRDTPSRY